ncbi:1-aminocyclopropane-1-carboxylate oxidase [Penicillium rolfsii]|nr:1-aminocyclopropane-1-carboxylate oxidase [Penicillium rolfsii]
MHRGPPVIDFAPFYGQDESARSKLKDEIRDACLNYGFFQLRNHGIPEDLQREILRQSEDFFSLPIEIKEKYDKAVGGFGRGYERLRSQNFEKLEKGDLKEGYFLAQDLPLDDPYVRARKWAQGPNKYPSEVTDPSLWKKTVDNYHSEASKVAKNVLRVIFDTLGEGHDFLDEFCEHPVAVLRLLHYPPQDPNASDLERGIGAHTDFGAVTILLQDSTGGLQVRDRKTGEWTDVEPIPDAVVVNTGNLIMCWTNGQYVSNLHRVVNKTGVGRYSVPFFFDGNPDFLVKCFDSCIKDGEVATHAPFTVSEWMKGRYADTFGGSTSKIAKELVQI